MTHTGLGGSFAFILVIFILLVIIGAVVATPHGYGYY
ncbi:MAG: YjcZ family sporulation protein [Bacillus sp. (in: Bacteria)]|nr:YjcZ family sporulation protein [Bacillus sp. (in: firmicutes)]